jgi:hypothetical protein
VRVQRLLLLVPLVACLGLGLTPADAKGIPVSNTYVALGDSFASGPLVPVQDPQAGGCFRSTSNYAHLLASRLGMELRDATCSGAQTKDMTGAQDLRPSQLPGEARPYVPEATNPPQYDQLDKRVALVTLQIGGNDIGFADIAFSCGDAAAHGQACRTQYLDEGGDELAARIAAAEPKVRDAVKGIRKRSPKARVFVLGYPSIFRLSAGDVPSSCPAMGMGEDDADYLQGIQVQLNRMIERAAVSVGATYVDLYAPSAGRTACDTPVLRWVEPIVPVNAAFPIHPNLNGMRGVADLLQGAVTGTPGATDLRLPDGSPEPPAVPSPFDLPPG